MIQAGDYEAALEVVRRDLLWLLDRDADTLGAQQRQIAVMLRELLASDPPGGAE